MTIATGACGRGSPDAFVEPIDDHEVPASGTGLTRLFVAGEKGTYSTGASVASACPLRAATGLPST